MAIALVGQKIGMTRLLSDDGSASSVSVIKIEPNRIVQTKNVDTDGYSAVQVTTGKKTNKKGDAKVGRVSRSLKGHYAKASQEIGLGLWEMRVDDSDVSDMPNLDISFFGTGHFVNVTGQSKGKGFQGGVKRHNFSMQDATHGNSISHRAIGSTGQCQDAGRVFKGKKMAGQMGNAQVTEECLEILRVDNERNLLLVKGAIPGSKNGFVRVFLSDKKNSINNQISKQLSENQALEAETEEAPVVEAETEEAPVVEAETEESKETEELNKKSSYKGFMMKVKVLNLKTNKSTSQEVSDEIFGRNYNESLVHQITTAYMAAGRSGSKAQKNRSAVSGGGKKPWKQKGTGRARAGTSRGPIWRSGGVTFAAQPRNYSQKVNKKMYKGAISVIFSELLRKDRLKIVSDIEITEPKTKNITSLMKSLDLKDALLMTDELDENLYLSSRNLYHVGVCDTQSIDPVSLIGYENVVMTKAALKKVEAML